MENMRKLPLILSLTATILIGAVSFSNAVEPKATYIRMAVVLLVTYFLGVYIRNTITKLYEEVKEKTEKKKREEEEEAIRHQQNKEEGNKEQPANAHNVDYRVDSDEFTPMKVSDIIKSK